MAIIGLGEVTVADLTDAYAVQLSGYSHSFPGTADGKAMQGSVTVTATARCGATQVDCNISEQAITKPTGISATVTKAQGSMSPVVTIAASTSFTKANSGTVTIPVTVTTPDNETLTYSMDYSVTVSDKGNTPVITGSKSGTTTTILADGTQIATIEDGLNGTNGLNQATVYLYKRADSASKPSSGTSTYTFATGVLSNVPSGWSQTFPAETQGSTTPAWVMVAVASSNGATDDIAASEWTTPVKMVSSGSNGTAGYNQATVFLYKRAATAPSAPTAGQTYTFATGALSALPSGWTRTVPNGSDPLYVTQAACVSRDATYTISAWNTPTKLAEDGENALTIVVTPSAYVFKNSSGSVTFRAHVYDGNSELSASEISSLGTVKWYVDYKGDGTDTVKQTGLSFEVTPSMVSTGGLVRAQLES